MTFSAGVIGTPPFAYQWISNNVALPGATNAAFTLTDVSLSDSATYTVLVTNNFGSQLSSNAVLAVFPALEVTPPTYLYEIDSSAVAGGRGSHPIRQGPPGPARPSRQPESWRASGQTR